MSKTEIRALLTFFALTFGWTWGLWAIVTFRGLGLTGLGAVLLLVSAFGPSLAAVVTVLAFEGKAGFGRWLRRSLHLRVGWLWYALALLAPPLVILAALGGVLPPSALQGNYLTAILVFVQITLLGSPLGEEFGWRGYALPAMSKPIGWRWAAIVLHGRHGAGQSADGAVHGQQHSTVSRLCPVVRQYALQRAASDPAAWRSQLVGHRAAGDAGRRRDASLHDRGDAVDRGCCDYDPETGAACRPARQSPMMMIYLLQTALPLAPILWLAILPPRNRAGFWLLALAAALLILVVALQGIWVFPPWWVPYLMALLLVVAVTFRLIRAPVRSWLPTGLLGWLGLVIFGGIAGWSGAQSWESILARQMPAGPSIALAWPLGPGIFLVANGGVSASINAHAALLDPAQPLHAGLAGRAMASI